MDHWPVSDVNLTFGSGLWDRHRGLPACGRAGALRIIVCIEDQVVIQKILDHLARTDETGGPFPLPERRALPGPLFG